MYSKMLFCKCLDTRPNLVVNVALYLKVPLYPLSGYVCLSVVSGSSVMLFHILHCIASRSMRSFSARKPKSGVNGCSGYVSATR